MSKIFHPVYDWWLEANVLLHSKKIQRIFVDLKIPKIFKLWKIFEHAQKLPAMLPHIKRPLHSTSPSKIKDFRV
jgi:hypothetical protein